VRIGVVIQARTGSTRMPGKVLLPLAGRPLLQRMIERVQAASAPFEIVVATTTDPADEPVRDLCRSIGVRVTSGHPTDLLDRHHQAARETGADVVVKIPSDCPLIDPLAIDLVLGAPLLDFTSNLHPPTWPDGNDVEVMPFSVLDVAWREAKKPHEREHTTPFIWDQPDRFRITNITWPAGLDYSMTHRFTIDYREDYDFLRAVYDALWTTGGPIFGLGEILSLLEAQPTLCAINARYCGVNWYRKHLHDLRTVSRADTRSVEP
jgi:spore coat polysaccharide biosynthesis protein SpsF